MALGKNRRLGGAVLTVLLAVAACLVTTGCGGGGGYGGGGETGTLSVDSDFATGVTIDFVSYSIPQGVVTGFIESVGSHTCSSAYYSPTSVYVPGSFYAG